ncbi:unnamed protein product [Mycena citricolor]|uniref:Uncharacterized protein n=1 Tax=Mycena citricolor TaxID=2018698 RepID=A0AAD2Q0Z4_9AGAR|nr:unnamed protein product [Mycena citricolor]CAK5279420.1 unnamed protein product [Mycena citricolor]
MTDVVNPTDDMPAAVSEAAAPAEKAPAVATSGTDPEDPVTMAKAARQIEFYFADSNLPFDRFMWTLHTKTSEHWVPIATVASFKRMRPFSTFGTAWVARALREKSTSLEVDAEGVNVRRTSEVQEPKDQLERSVYAKGFPEENSTLQTRLEEFFEQYGPTNAVRMRRDNDKKFKLSVFAEFTSQSAADAFLNAEPAPAFDGVPLLTMSKEAYCDMKVQEKGLTGKAADFRKNVYSGRKFDAFREMANGTDATMEDATGKDKEDPKEVYLEFMGSTILIRRNGDGVGEVDEADVPFVKGATLRFDGVDAASKVFFATIKVGTRFVLLSALTRAQNPLKEKFGRPPFIQHTIGNSFGLVGFHKELNEDEIQFVKDSLPKIGDKVVSWGPVGEEEEKQFQIERAQGAAKLAIEQAGTTSSLGSRGRGRDRGGARGRGGRGGRDRGRGRGRGGRDSGRSKGPATANTDMEDSVVGEKRKRPIEPDGGPNVGVRGKGAPPAITSKRNKAEEGS